MKIYMGSGKIGVQEAVTQWPPFLGPSQFTIKKKENF
jgi:hypothetical protein